MPCSTTAVQEAVNFKVTGSNPVGAVGDVAQLVRATACHAVGRGFEPRHSRLIMNPVQLLLLIGELEGSSAQCRKLGFTEDAATLDEMKRRYYKMYFKSKKEWTDKN